MYAEKSCLSVIFKHTNRLHTRFHTRTMIRWTRFSARCFEVLCRNQNMMTFQFVISSNTAEQLQFVVQKIQKSILLSDNKPIVLIFSINMNSKRKAIPLFLFPSRCNQLFWTKEGLKSECFQKATKQLF